MKTENHNSVQLVESADGTLKLLNLPNFGNSFKQFSSAFGKASSEVKNIAKQYADRQQNINLKRAVLFSKNYFEIQLNSIIADILKNSGKFRVTKRLMNGGTSFELVKL